MPPGHEQPYFDSEEHEAQHGAGGGGSGGGNVEPGSHTGHNRKESNGTTKDEGAAASRVRSTSSATPSAARDTAAAAAAASSNDDGDGGFPRSEIEAMEDCLAELQGTLGTSQRPLLCPLRLYVLHVRTGALPAGAGEWWQWQVLGGAREAATSSLHLTAGAQGATLGVMCSAMGACQAVT